MRSARVFAAEFAQEDCALFGTDGSQRIALGPGTVRCSYGFSAASERQNRRPEEEVSCWLELPDQRGRLFRIERRIPANLFLELVRLGQPVVESAEHEVILSGIRCWHDRRRYIPAIGLTEAGKLQPFAYFAESLGAELDLLGDGHRVVIRVHPTEGGGIGGAPTPKVLSRTSWGPRLILWPSLIHEAVDPEIPSPTFFRTGGTAEAQSTVVVE